MHIQRLLCPALIHEFSYLTCSVFFWVSSWGLNLVKRFMVQMHRLIFQSIATIFVLYTLNWSLQLPAWRRKTWLGGLLILSGSDVQPITLQQTDLGQTISNSSKKSHEYTTKQNVYALPGSCVCGFVLVRYIQGETTVRSNTPSLPYKWVIKLNDFPNCCFPLHSNFAREHLIRKEYWDCDMCGIHLQVLLTQNERDQSFKTHFTLCLYIVAEIRRIYIVYSANAHKYRMSCALCFVLALQIISVQSWYLVAQMDACL